MFNMQKMMAQVQKFQQQAEKVQQELEASTVKGSAGGGLIEVEMDGQAKFKSIKLTKEAINAENPESVDDETIEMLEDLITSAINDAAKQAGKLSKDKLSQITGGMNLPPGIGSLLK